MASGPRFFLRTAALPGEEPSPYTGLYIRHHGSGINSVVLTLTVPKFIKAYEDGDGISFDSVTHEGRRWGLTLRTDGGQRAGWEKVEIVENGGSQKLSFSKAGGGNGEDFLEYAEQEAGENVWKGWMVCDWAHGHPQLFWVTDQLQGELPKFCHRVQIVREML
jgi:hypothetical protein